MPKISRLALLLLFSLVFEILFPWIASVKIRETFAYGTQTKAISGDFETVSLDRSGTSFTLRIESAEPIENEDDVTAEISDGTTTQTAFLDLAGDEGATGIYFTEPVNFPSTRILSVRLIAKNPKLSFRTEIIALDTTASGVKLAFDPSGLAANAAPGGVLVVPRAEWGADESLRYEDSPVWKKIRSDQEKHKNDPVSETAKKYQKKLAAIEDHLRSDFSEEFRVTERIDEEKGHPLVWPIEKTPYVKKIVVHHTAENNLSNLSDENLLRSTYYYHAVTRGWGDIGYQYVVGQRGKVYEGRAGGDYIVGAHVSWNNRQTVGVSVIGNFSKENVNRDQEAGLQTFLSYLVKRYGIDMNASITAHRECKKDDCLTEDYATPAIVGHRDVGYTDCPGKNIYPKLVSYKEALMKLGSFSPVKNPVERPEAVPKKRVPEKLASLVVPSSPKKALAKGPTIRVKLSIPDVQSVELEAVEGAPNLTFDKTFGGIKSTSIILRRNKLNQLELVLDGKKYRGKIGALTATVVKVKGWDRKPSWDTSGKYNDNVFRGKIEVRVVGKKLELINELSLEDYLKGLAEVSNGDPEDKIKTILVAARSYALWYTDAKNRKFPGKPYDASDDPDVFQKYLGYGYELRSPNVAKLVDATNGEIVTYQ